MFATAALRHVHKPLVSFPQRTHNTPQVHPPKAAPKGVENHSGKPVHLAKFSKVLRTPLADYEISSIELGGAFEAPVVKKPKSK